MKTRFCFPFSGERARRTGFTLLEMMITLAIFILLAAAVFGLMSGVLESTGTLQDNLNRKDQTVALNAFLKKRLGEMPVGSTLVSYARGNGEGLEQNGILFGTSTYATVIDATQQANGYYTLRLTTYSTSASTSDPQDARTALLQLVTTNDPTVTWTQLITDIKTLDWKFLDFNQTVWVDLWTNNNKPNLVEFSLQPAGDLQSSTMDFWIPKIDPVSNAGAAPTRLQQ